MNPLEQDDLELPDSHSEQLSPGIGFVGPGHLDYEKIREIVEEELAPRSARLPFTYYLADLEITQAKLAEKNKRVAACQKWE